MAMKALADVLEAIGEALVAEIPQPSRRFVVGYSGGIDSTVLLASLARIVDPARIAALHVDHALVPESSQWARHCEIVGGTLAVAMETIRVEVGARGNREERARLARYRVFESRIGPTDVLLLAHNADDQAETLLLRLVQGRPPRGMPERRRLGRGTLVRPLLRLPRRTIAQAADALAARWVEDASNRDVAFDRNFVRHEVMPRLRARWPDAASRLERQARSLRAVHALAERALDAELEPIGSRPLPIALVERSDHGARLVRRWLERQGVHGTPERTIDEAIRQLERCAEGRALVRVAVRVAPARELRAFAGALHLVEIDSGAFVPIAWRLDAPLALGSTTLRATWASHESPVAACVEVRPRVGGERLRVDAGRGERSVKRLLHDARVPPWRRARYPLVYWNGNLAVVPGIAVAADAAERFATGGANPARERACWFIAIDLALDR